MSRNALFSATSMLRVLMALCIFRSACVFAESTPAASTTRSNRTSRVLIVEDPRATDAYQARPDHVMTMVEMGITNYTGQPTQRQAWLSLVSTQDIVGIKVYSAPGPNSGTRPAVVAAVVQGLLAAGLPPHNIIVWDKSEADLREAGFFELETRFDVRVEASVKTGWDPTNSYETQIIGTLVKGDYEFEKQGDGVGRKSFVSKLVSQEMTKIINITPLLNHNEAGVCGNIYSLAMGSVDNTFRFEGQPARLATAVPEIYGLPILYDRVVLNITDALVCQYEGGQRGLLHYATMLNQIRFSKDAVALDMLSVKELDRQRRKARAPAVRPNLELYRNASLLELGVSDLSKMHINTIP